jgi:membrane-associated protease RseP (regulator of RpoE activity)
MAEPPSRAGSRARARGLPWLNLVMFAATVASTFYVGRGWAVPFAAGGAPPWYAGWTFAVPLLAILLVHEFGHYVAARLHKVDASLPFFIPFPVVFGTFGAIIKMRGRIATRRALLDIGAAGPLAGMAVALPTVAFGLSLSEVQPQVPGDYLLEGHSLLYKGLLALIHGPIPPGHDVFLHPVALAGWVGLFVTMLNLLPVGQLDGGHVAYALFREAQDRVSTAMLLLLPALGLGVCGFFGYAAWSDGLRGEQLVSEASTGANWFVWTLILLLMRRFAGPKHPPVDAGPLGAGRVAVGLFCIVLFVSIFMPVPLRAVTVAAP